MGINVYPPVSSGVAISGFNLDVGTSGNTTFVLSDPQPAGLYSITSKLSDLSLEFYAVASDNTLAGYTNTKSLTATKDFTKVVVYGATNNDVITFEFKETSSPASSGDLDGGAAPFITSVSDADLANINDTTIITGGNFATDITVTFTGTDSVVRNAKSVVRTNSTQLIVTRPDAFLQDNSPYTLTVANPGITQSAIRTNTSSITAGGDPVWVTAAGSLINALINQSYSATLSATDPDGGTVSYSVASGTLPTGLQLDSATGVIAGIPTVLGTASFVITATDSGGNTTNRSFSILVTSLVSATGGTIVTSGGYRYHTFTSNGTFSVTNSGDVEILAIAGGGAGGSGGGNGGGGGAGGLTTYSGPLSTGNYAITIGAGGTGANATNATSTTKGQDTTFGSLLTSNGGGKGADWVYQLTSPSNKDGGSGGGGWGNAVVGTGYGPGYGISGQGFNGGQGASGGAYAEGTGGGGGATEAGSNAGYIANSNGKGGNGTSAYSVWGAATSTGQNISGTRWYAGGGGGGAPASSASGWTIAGVGGNGGGGAGGPVNNTSLVAATNGSANTGGGGGGGSYRSDGGSEDAGLSGNGGSGIVIVRYLI